MPSVKIETNGVTVELNANEASYADLADKALQVWREAGGTPTHEREPVGFAAQSATVERRQGAQVHAPQSTPGRRFPPEVTA